MGIVKEVLHYMMSDSKDLLRMLNLCESEVEKLFLLAAYEHIDGLVPQYTVLRYRIDFAIPDKMIAIEIDGHEYHKTKEQRTNDAQREREIKLELPANWTVIRFTGSEIFQNTTRCVDEVLQFIQKKSPYLITSINKPKIQYRTDNCDADGWYNKGVALGELGKYDEAIKAYNEAIRVNPDLIVAWFQKGNALHKQGKYDAAIKTYDAAIRLDPKYPIIWSNKGVSLGNQGRYDEAIKCYDEAIRLDPNSDDAWNNKGNALYKQGKNDEAIRAYDEAIQLDPNNAKAWHNKGNAVADQGKYDEAIKVYEKAIELKPKYACIWNKKGEALKNQGKYKDMALKLLGRTTEADAAFAKAKELGYSG